MRKSLKTLLITMLILTCAAIFTFAASANNLGDVDGSGDVNSEDARLTLRASVELEHFEPGSQEFNAADVDFDNSITSDDARTILRVAVQLEELPDACNHVWTTYEVKTSEDTASPVKTTQCKSAGANTGYHVYTCSKCGEIVIEDCTYAEQKYPQAPRNPGPATCTESFTWYQRCTVCYGAKVGTDPKLNHAGKILNAEKSVGATCTAPGVDWYECPLCGKNGDTLAELKVNIAPLGHNVSADSISGDQDIVCTRCNKVIMPSFNTLVNGIKKNNTIYFSSISKQESKGDVLASDIKISNTAKWMMQMMGESLSEQDIIDEFTEELNKPDSEYADYRWQSQLFYQHYPLKYSYDVSRLTAADIKSITVQDVNKIDFIDELPDSVMLKINTSLSRTQDLTEFKGLGNTTGNIQKVTVQIVQEKLSEVQGSATETALMRANGIDIRSYSDMFNQINSDDGFEIKMTCKDITTDCAITYYFLVTQDGDDTVYTPLAARYFTDINIDPSISLNASFAITEGGSPIEIMTGAIDLRVNNSDTDYYIFSPVS